MSITSHEFDVLALGTKLPNGATVIWCNKEGERIIGEQYASWTALCHWEGNYHPYVVWRVCALPDGWYTEQGDYYKTEDEAWKGFRDRA
jgi:hypothetical protein